MGILVKHLPNITRVLPKGANILTCKSHGHTCIVANELVCWEDPVDSSDDSSTMISGTSLDNWLPPEVLGRINRLRKKAEDGAVCVRFARESLKLWANALKYAKPFIDIIKVQGEAGQQIMLIGAQEKAGLYFRWHTGVEAPAAFSVALYTKKLYAATAFANDLPKGGGHETVALYAKEGNPLIIETEKGGAVLPTLRI